MCCLCYVMLRLATCILDGKVVCVWMFRVRTGQRYDPLDVVVRESVVLVVRSSSALLTVTPGPPRS